MGKGTQCDLLVKEYSRSGFNSNISGAYNKKLNRIGSMCHISAGELLRQAMADVSNKYSHEIRTTINNGGIVKAQITVNLLNEVIKNHLDSLENQSVHQSSTNVILVDGFPRNIANMEAWNEHAHFRGPPTVINFKCSDEVLLQRLHSRMLRSSRSDDNLQSIEKRIKTYHAETVPIVELKQLLTCC